MAAAPSPSSSDARDARDSPASRDERETAWAAWIAVATLVGLSAWHRWHVLAQSPYPVGIDGYYYVIQVRSLLERGHLAYPAAPLVFWLIAPIARITDDPVFAVKIVAAIGGALAIVPAYLIGRRVGGIVGGLTAAVVVAVSGGSFYLSLEFVKNGVGLTIALTAVWLGMRALERLSPTRIALAVAAVTAAGLAHKMAALVAVALLVPAVIVELRARRVPWGVWRALAISAGFLLAALIAASIVEPDRVIGPRDFALLSGAIGEPDWRLPAMATVHGHHTSRLMLGDQGWIVLAIVVGFGLATTLLLEFLPAPRAVRRADDAVAWAALALAAATCLPWLAVDQPDGIGFRLRVAAFVPAAIVAAAAVGRATAALTAPWRLVAVVPPLLAWLAVRAPEPHDGMVKPHPAMVAAMQALPGRVPDGGVVITVERDAGFMAAWYARVPVRLRPDPVPHDRRWRLIPLGVSGKGSRLDRAISDARRTSLPPPIGLHPGDPNGLVLIPEVTWDWILDHLSEPDATWWREWHTI